MFTKKFEFLGTSIVHNVYTCPYCDDYLPKTKFLIEQKKSNPQETAELQEIYDFLPEHQQKWRTQTDYFLKLWNDPPEFTLAVAEDAGKRFVLEGCSHVMMLRFKQDGTIRTSLLLLYYRNEVFCKPLFNCKELALFGKCWCCA